MKYLVRINKKAWNPITGKVVENRVWEVEQAENKDSQRIIWHCANVTIKRGQDEIPIAVEIGKAAGDKRVTEIELTFYGLVFRGQDDAIVIDVRSGHDVS